MSRSSDAVAWHLAGYRRTIYWEKRVWLDLVAECQAGFLDNPWGGVEVGGILLGSREGNDLIIENFLAAECEHSYGPSFELSTTDRETFTDLIASQQSLGRVVIGCWHSVSHRKADLSSADIDLSTEYFPEPWQVSLIIRRSATEKAEPVVFVWQDRAMVQAEVGGNSTLTAEADASLPTIDLFPVGDLLEQPDDLWDDEEDLPSDGIPLAAEQAAFRLVSSPAAVETEATSYLRPIVPEVAIGALGLVRLIGNGLRSSSGPVAGPRRYKLQFGAPSRPLSIGADSQPLPNPGMFVK